MKNSIAERKLLYSLKDSNERKELIIRIGQPYIVESGTVNFTVDADTAGCSVELDGLDKAYSNVTYGADLLQALQLAINVEPLLKSLSKKYNFYFTTGEPYFEEENDSNE